MNQVERVEGKDFPNDPQLQKFQELLMKHYLVNDKISQLIPASGGQMSIKNHYIELLLRYDNNKTKNEPIKMEELFQEKDLSFNTLSENDVKTILIKGGPGSGKSTLMTKLAYDWAEQKRANTSKYIFLFRINLKILLEQYPYAIKNESDSLINLLLLSTTNIIDSTLQSNKYQENQQNYSKKAFFESALKSLFLKKQNHKKIIFLLDGYDQVIALENTEENASLKNKFLTELLEQAKKFNTVITSRPNAAQRSSILKKFKRVVEIQKLNDKAIKNFIQAFFEKKDQLRNSLENVLKSDKKLAKMLESPLNLAMVCTLLYLLHEKRKFQLSNDQSTKIDELYLYSEMIKEISRRYLQRTSQQRGIVFDQNFSNLSLKDLQKFVQPLKNLKQLILQAYLENKTIISRQNVERKEIALKKLENLREFGLLKQNEFDTQNTGKNEKKKEQYHYEFIHLSFAEFLVAHSIYQGLETKGQINKEDDQQSKNYQLFTELISKNRYSPKYFNIIRYVTMLASKAYWEKKESFALETLWVCLTCNIDGVLQFGREQPLKLLMEMLNLCKNPSPSEERKTVYPNIRNITQAQQFIQQSYCSRKTNKISQNKMISEEDAYKDQELTPIFRWYKLIIESKYIPQPIMTRLGQIAQKTLQTLSAGPQQNRQKYILKNIKKHTDILKIFFEIVSHFIYANDSAYFSGHKIKIIQTFIRAINLPDQYLQVKIAAFQNIKRLFSYLPEIELVNIFSEKENISSEKQELEIILKGLNHQQTYNYAFDLLIYSLNKLQSEKKRVTLKILTKLQTFFNQKSPVPQSLILKSLNLPIFAQHRQNIKSLRMQYVQLIKTSERTGQFNIQSNQSHNDVSSKIKIKIFNLLTFFIYNKEFVQQNKALKVQELIKQLNRINMEHEIQIWEDDDKEARQILHEKLKEFVRKNQSIKEKFYFNSLIPNSWGKFLNNMSFIIEWMEKNQKNKETAFIIYKIIPKMFHFLEVKQQNSVLNLYQKNKANQYDQQRQKMLKMKAIKVLSKKIDLVGLDQQKYIVEQAVKFLSNQQTKLILNAQLLLFECFLKLGQVQQKTIVKETVQLLSNDDSDVVKNALLFFSQCFDKIDSNYQGQIVNEAVKLLSRLNYIIVNNALLFFSQLFKKIGQALRIQIVKKMVQLLSHQQKNIRQNVKKIYSQNLSKIDQKGRGNIFKKAILLLSINNNGIAENSQLLLSQCFLKIGQVQQKTIVKETVQLLSNNDSDVVKNALLFFSQCFDKIDSNYQDQILNTIKLCISNQQQEVILNGQLFLFQCLNKITKSSHSFLIQQVLKLLSNQHLNVKKKARQLLCKHFSQMDSKIQTAIINQAAKLLSNTNITVAKNGQQLISQCFCKINSIQQKKIIDQAAQLLSSQELSVVKVVQQLISKCFDKIDQIQQQNILKKVVQLLFSNDISVVKVAKQLISKCFDKIDSKQQQNILKKVVQLLSSNDISVVNVAQQLISKYFDKIGSKQQQNILNWAAQLLSRNDQELIKNAQQLLLNYFFKIGSDSQKQIIRSTVLLLSSNDITVAKNAQQIISSYFDKFDKKQQKFIIKEASKLLLDNNFNIANNVQLLVAKNFLKFDQPQKRNIISKITIQFVKYDLNIVKNVQQFLSKWFNYIDKAKQINIIQMLSHKNSNVLNNALLFFIESFQHIELIQQKTIINMVISLLQGNINWDVISNALLLLSSCIDIIKYDYVKKKDIINKAEKLISDSNENVAKNALLLLSKWFIQFNQLEQIQLIDKIMKQLSQNKVNEPLLFVFCHNILSSIKIQARAFLFKKILPYLYHENSTFVDKTISIILSVINQQGLWKNEQISNKFKQVQKITISSPQAAKDLIKMIKILIKGGFSIETLQHLGRITLNIKGVFPSACQELQDLLKESEILNDEAIKRIKQDPKEFLGQNYRILVELAKANSKIFQAVEEVYKIAIDQTYSLIKKEGIQLGTLKAIKQQLKDNRLDIQSYFSRELLIRLIGFYFENQELNSQKADFLKFCIKAELSITFTFQLMPITRYYGITVGDSFYVINEGLQHYFNLLRDLRKENASSLFKDGRPIFQNDGEHGIKRSAIDIENVQQIFLACSKQQKKRQLQDHLIIDYDKVKLLRFNEEGNIYYILSKRNQFGYISIRRIDTKIDPQTSKVEFITPYGVQKLKYPEDSNNFFSFKQTIIGPVKDAIITIFIVDIKLETDFKNGVFLIQNLNKYESSIWICQPKWRLLGLKSLPQQLLQKKINKCLKIINFSGLNLNYNINLKLNNLGSTQKQKDKIMLYYRTAFWKLYNIIQSLELISVGNLQADKTFQFKDQLENIFIAEKITDFVLENEQKIPVFGKVLKIVANYISSKLKKNIQREFDNKITVIKHIFQKPNNDNDDRNLLIKQLCFELTKSQKEFILQKEEEKKNDSYIESFFKKAKEIINSIDQIGLKKELQQELQKKREAIAANIDIATLLFGMMSNSESIMKKEMLKRQQIVPLLLSCFSGQPLKSEKNESNNSKEQLDMKKEYKSQNISQPLCKKLRNWFCIFLCCQKDDSSQQQQKSKPPKKKIQEIQMLEMPLLGEKNQRMMKENNRQ